LTFFRNLGENIDTIDSSGLWRGIDNEIAISGNYVIYVYFSLKFYTWTTGNKMNLLIYIYDSC
jgi:hypothetical protein